MLGQFSDKLDIFSFGVMVLEIITGKRNSNSYQAPHFDGLLNFVSTNFTNSYPFY